MDSLWLFLAGAGMGATLSLPYFRRHRLLVDAPAGGIVISALMILAAATLMAVSITRVTIPGLNVVWWGVSAVFLVAIIAYELLSCDYDYEPLAYLVVGIALLAGLVAPLTKIFPENTVRVDHGTVIGQEYVPGYMTQTCSGRPAACFYGFIDDRWRLRLRNCDTGECVEGTLDFNENVFDRYPIGASYP